MAAEIKTCSASPLGGWLLVISAPSIECSPAVDSRGSLAAITPSGVAEECGCQSHTRAERGCDDRSGFEGKVVGRKLARTNHY